MTTHMTIAWWTGAINHSMHDTQSSLTVAFDGKNWIFFPPVLVINSTIFSSLSPPHPVYSAASLLSSIDINKLFKILSSRSIVETIKGANQQTSKSLRETHISGSIVVSNNCINYQPSAVNKLHYLLDDSPSTLVIDHTGSKKEQSITLHFSRFSNKWITRHLFNHPLQSI